MNFHITLTGTGETCGVWDAKTADEAVEMFLAAAARLGYGEDLIEASKATKESVSCVEWADRTSCPAGTRAALHTVRFLSRRRVARAE